MVLLCLRKEPSIERGREGGGVVFPDVFNDDFLRNVLYWRYLLTYPEPFLTCSEGGVKQVMRVSN